MKDTLILGIESSCDETACAIVRNGREILSDVIASQADFHEQYGGVVPELASRMHVDSIYPTLEKCLADAGVTLEDIDGVAVTYGPGLVGALLPLAAVSLLYRRGAVYLMERFNMLSDIFRFLPLEELFPSMAAVSLGLGIGIGFFVSFFTIRKQLKV